MLNRIKRTLRHRWLSTFAAQPAISAALSERLHQLVTASEKHHTGEIRIFIETGLPLSYLLREQSTSELARQRALAVFGRLRVWDTENNNGVLIYLLLAERHIELIADRGLNTLVSPQEWSNLISKMSSAFQRNDYETGLIQALSEVSALLTIHFPLEAGEHNTNELPDVPVIG